jgi:hypothetical protein
MGLYDKPLPPRPEPRDDENNDDDEDEEEAYGMPQRLFQFDDLGNEINGLLPPLGRFVTDTSLPINFPVENRRVQVLAQNSGCNPLDAGWALEAHQGDDLESRMAITMARRVGLKQQQETLPESTADVDWDSELSTLMRGDTDPQEVIRPLGNDFEKRRSDTNNNMIDPKMGGLFDKGTPDDKWLPGTDNPTPVDDEPWFTG